MLTGRLMVLTQTVPLALTLTVRQKLNSLTLISLSTHSLNQNRTLSDIVMSETIPTITVINYYTKVIKLLKR